MGVWDLVQCVLATTGGGFCTAFGLACLWPDTAGRNRKVLRRSGSSARGGMVRWPAAPACAAPSKPLTIAEAHASMQQHRAHHCARKHAAWDVLVAAGRIVPDSSRRNGAL